LILLLVIIGSVLIYFRFAGYKSQSFQAIAHLFVGGLFGSFLSRSDSGRWPILILALLMTFAELLAFLRSRRVD
jgi:hypothetical protein